uniref:Uncharacterized protein n=1 Tax=Peronospora matthiolae TaxID=2874970 RepID=A0AAV1TBE4_9STRA
MNQTRQTHAKSFCRSSSMLVLVLGLVGGLVVTDVNARTGAGVPPVMVMSDLETDLTADSATRPATVLPAGHDEEDDTSGSSSSSSWNVSRFHRGGVRRRSRMRRRKKATTSRAVGSEGVPATIAPASTETGAESEVAAREMLKGVPGAVGTLPTPVVDAYNTLGTPEAPTPVQMEPSVPAVVLAAAPTPAPVAPEVPKPATVPTEAPTPAPVPSEASMPAPIPAEAPLPALIPGEVPAPAPVLPEAPTPAPIPPEAVIPAIVPADLPAPAPIPGEPPTPAPILPGTPVPAPVPADAPTPAPIPGEPPTPAPIPGGPPTPAPIPGEPPTPAPVPGEPPTPAPIPGGPPTPAPIPGEPPTPAPIPGGLPTPAPVPGGPPTPAPIPGEPPTPAPVPVEPPTPASVPTEVLTPGPTPAPAALTPTPVPIPVDADVPLPPYNPTPEALPKVPAITTPTTAATTLPTELPREDIPSPIEGSSSSNTPNSTTDSFDSDVTSASTHYEDATQDLVDESSDRTPDDSSSTSLVLTFAPIIADHATTDSSADPELNHDVHHSNASTSAGRPRPLGGWKLALVVIGAICVVIVSIILVHMRYVRVAAANKRHRGSSQQRALDSFFRQNRVTVGRETGISSGVFVTDPLTPRDEIAVTMPMDARFQTQTVDFTAAAPVAAPAYVRRPYTPGVLDTPTDSHQGQEFDSFTGPAPLALSSSSSSLYWSNSVSSDANSASHESLDLSGQLLPPLPVAIRAARTSSVTFSTDVMRDTNRSEQSRSGFSVRFATSTSPDDVNWTSTSQSEGLGSSALPVSATTSRTRN